MPHEGKGVGNWGARGWQGLWLLHSDGEEGAGIAKVPAEQRLRWSCTSAPHMGRASWEHPWEGWGEGHALPRSSPRKKQWHKSISRVINHPERGYGGCNCLWEKQNPEQSCQELAPAGSHCSPALAPSGMVIHGQEPSRELTASAQP